MARKKKQEEMIEPLYMINKRMMEEQGLSWTYAYNYGETDEDTYIPVGCRACGGDYPLCKQGCPLFDDE